MEDHSVRAYRGDDEPLGFLLTDGETRLPLDLSGSTFILTVDTRKAPTDTSTKVFSLTGVSESPLTGVIFFYPTKANMNLDPKTYYYDIERTNAQGNKKTLVVGKFIITQDITK